MPRCPCGEDAAVASCWCESCAKPLCAECIAGSEQEMADSPGAETAKCLCRPCYDRVLGAGHHEEDDGD